MQINRKQIKNGYNDKTIGVDMSRKQILVLLQRSKYYNQIWNENTLKILVIRRVEGIIKIMKHILH